ncbi:MAG: hypothetical protein IPM45_05000 [Acidimicrobiales bacterium]|nr:hypothetical protein [Acidimicrobiales bacterium]
MTADRAAVERILDQREATGRPRTITDPAILARVAAILNDRPDPVRAGSSRLDAA